MPVSFGPPGKQLNTFGVDADGWSSQDIYPRLLADIDNDGKADIVGFGHDGVITSLANGTGGFSQQALVGNTANWGTFSGGWDSQDLSPRLLADVNGDGFADLVGFGQRGVYVSLNNQNGTFNNLEVKANTSFWTPGANGWFQDEHPRFLADIEGNHRADIVGFSDSGLWVSRNNLGTFLNPTPVDSLFWGTITGGWTSQEKYPRFFADIDHDGDADIVGFGANGVYVSSSDGMGGFRSRR